MTKWPKVTENHDIIQHVKDSSTLAYSLPIHPSAPKGTFHKVNLIKLCFNPQRHVPLLFRWWTTVLSPHSLQVMPQGLAISSWVHLIPHSQSHVTSLRPISAILFFLCSTDTQNPTVFQCRLTGQSIVWFRVSCQFPGVASNPMRRDKVNICLCCTSRTKENSRDLTEM